MNNKFWFLTKESLKKKICTKAFVIVNIVLCLLIVCLFNLDSIIKYFGGEFNELVNIYVVDESNIYNEFESIMNKNSLAILNNYNASLSLTNKQLDELEKNIKDNELKDIIVHIENNEEDNIEKLFNVEIISYEYIDTLLYNQIVLSINECKRNKALQISNINEELLDKIDKEIEIKRVLLNEELNENDELLELIGAALILVFILPVFMLIITVVQMIGAEINEEKSSKGMEIIISSVSPQTHFLSKIVSSNLFAIIQALLLSVYGIIGLGVKIVTTGPINIENDIGNLVLSASDETTDISLGEITNYIRESNVLEKISNGIPTFLIIIILTVLAYTLFIGILASVTTSMEDFNQIQTPVMMFLMAGYFLAIYASIFQGSSFINAISYIPFISGILSPVLYILGEISLLSLWISIIILIITILLFYKYGLRIYKVGILNYSSSNLWKKIFKALKN